MSLQIAEAWCDKVRSSKLLVVEKNALLAVAQLLNDEMTAANQHYADGHFDPNVPPFQEVEESTRGRCAMIQYNTNKRNIKALCEEFQNNLRDWINECAVRFGFSLPLHWEQ